MMKTAVQNAAYLKERGHELIPRGPLVEVLFTGDGPIGMHIVNVPNSKQPVIRGGGGLLDEESSFLSKNSPSEGTNSRKSVVSTDRVVVASAAEGAQADGRIFFGEQVIQVGELLTKGMKMKEVKLLIADAERPVRIVVQPLCFKSTRHEDFPLCPPMSPTFTDSKLLWGLLSRSHALEEIGPERRVSPKTYVDYVSHVPEFVFVRAARNEEDAEQLFEGDRIIEVDSKRGKLVLQGLLNAHYPGTQIIVQKVRVSGIIQCFKCNAREWVFSAYCSRCGAPQKKRRG